MMIKCTKLFLNSVMHKKVMDRSQTISSSEHTYKHTHTDTGTCITLHALPLISLRWQKQSVCFAVALIKVRVIVCKSRYNICLVTFYAKSYCQQTWCIWKCYCFCGHSFQLSAFPYDNCRLAPACTSLKSLLFAIQLVVFQLLVRTL